MTGSIIRIGYAQGQGAVAEEATRRFVTEFIGDEDVRIVPFANADIAMMRLSNGDVEYLVMRDTESDRRDLSQFSSRRISFSEIWRGNLPVRYVVAAPHPCQLSDVTAIIADDVAWGHVGETFRRQMGDRKYFRYGSPDGDISARKLKKQPDSYMRGTAVICSQGACEGTRLSRISDALVDGGTAEIGFVALER